MLNIDNMIEIREVKTKKEKKEFVNFPLKLYKNCEWFVPPFYADEMNLFNKNYHYYEKSEAVYYNAYKDGKMVGRISGILQKDYNLKNNEKRIRFTRFDSINDNEVAKKLFETVENWGRSKGMDTICGPLGFSDLEREGLLIDGFDKLATFEEQYNYDYYQGLIENLGYTKEVDWTERRLYKLNDPDKRFRNISDRMLKKYNLHYGSAKNIREFLKKYCDKIFELIDITYNDIYGTVPFTDGMKKSLLASFKLIVKMKYVGVILDENENMVCFSLCFPSIAKSVHKCKGHFTPFGIIRLLHEINHPKVIDLALIGVLPQYMNKGISTALIADLGDMMEKNNIEYAETNLNLEENYAIQNMWKNFENVVHKRRRSYIKKL